MVNKMPASWSVSWFCGSYALLAGLAAATGAAERVDYLLLLAPAALLGVWAARHHPGEPVVDVHGPR